MFDRLYELLFTIYLDRLFHWYPAKQAITWLEQTAKLMGIDSLIFQQTILPFMQRNESENAIIDEALWLLKQAGFEGKQLVMFSQLPHATAIRRVRLFSVHRRRTSCTCTEQELKTIKQFLSGLRKITGGIL